MQPDALAQEVAHALAAVVPKEAGVEASELATWLDRPPKPEMGDLAFPCFRLAKPLRTPPPKIAAHLAQMMQTDSGPIAEVSAAGPYLNLRLRASAAGATVLKPWATGDRPEFPAGEGKVMVEFSQPNTHKAFHVGHMRNLALGDCLVRMLRATGNEVVSANYLGDVGTHIAKCLWGYLELLDDDERTPPEEARGEWLGEIYARSTIALEDWESAGKEGDANAQAKYEAARARMTEILRAVEQRDEALTKLWNETRQWSLDEFDEIYAWTDVVFDRVFYESEVDEPSLKIVDEFLDKGVFVKDQGAIGIFNEEIEHQPFLMLRKSDGTGLYATKDLALARLKFEEYGIDRSIYVVDVRQSDHFKHVFATLKKMGFAQAEKCEHVPYDVVELPEGAMSTRKGTVVLFRALRERMLEHLLSEPYLGKFKGEWPDEELEATARALALGAIKYGMLDRDLNQKIVFDMERWLSPEGDTGPYIQYAAARAASILAKAEERGLKVDFAAEVPEGALEHPRERAVMVAIAGLPEAVSVAASKLRPLTLCGHLHDLAAAYNSFQNDPECRVLDAEGATLHGRLLLVKAAREALAWGLNLLGIPCPSRI